MSVNQKFTRPPFVIQARDYRLALGTKTQIMGIVNITPDSFSQDGCLAASTDYTRKAIALARRFVRQGADVIDIGGESTRPGSSAIPAREEIRRIIPAIRALVQSGIRVPISADTCKATVARHALDAGASIINNIRGARPNKSLLRIVQRYNAAIILMHMKGTPRTMQRRPVYRDLIGEIISSLENSIEICLEIGIKSDKIIVDPGIGFGKTLEQNLEILNRLRELYCINQPILIGTSRKSFIGKVLDKDVRHRLLGTAATVCASILHGAHIVRVHDVKAITETVRMTDAIVNQKVT